MPAQWPEPVHNPPLIVLAEISHKQWDGRPHPQTASTCQSGSVSSHLTRMGASAMNITTVGIDLAKNVFQMHGVDAWGKVALRRQLRREQVARFFVNLPPCLIGMEACASAHH